MNIFKLLKISLLILIIFTVSNLSAAMMEGEGGIDSKTLDLSKHHNVGNIWLRISNYGFFGSGSDSNPQWPSLEYPGGSGIDYLFQGALWFGAKKERKTDDGYRLRWVHFDNNKVGDDKLVVAEYIRDNTGNIIFNPEWDSVVVKGTNPLGVIVVDTLVTVGFDGDKSLYEFLPAWNPLEYNYAGYNANNQLDRVMTQSTRNQRRGFDDDGDGMIDEDMVGHDFPFRKSDELPEAFSAFAGKTIANTPEGADIIRSKPSIWFPLGFQDLSVTDQSEYLFTKPHDDDMDGLDDEDGSPVSEQDYISYYYDYSPFPNGSKAERDYGSSASSSTHVPLKIRVRQMSYQWSYDYIKNLVYVEFNITNMNFDPTPANDPNKSDILYDCAMGIYIDADVGPQSWDANNRSSDDVSGYVKGTGYEFAYTRDKDSDGGLTPGWLGVRVCTPDPEELEFACWYWKVGDGPDDFKPQNYVGISKKTANEKYRMLTGKNPDPTSNKYDSLRRAEQSEYEQTEQNGVDTRFLFAFYGDQKGYPLENATDKSWNLEPGKTMKIVVALFPGENLNDLKEQALWAKFIYGRAQTLETVVLPDTFPHYSPPEPPNYPMLHSVLRESSSNRIDLDVYWDNRSEFTTDLDLVSESKIGWTDRADLTSFDSHISNYHTGFPEQFSPDVYGGGAGDNAEINPYTAWRINHDFQGYKIWTRFGRGDNDGWSQQMIFDRIDNESDYDDHVVNDNLVWPGQTDPMIVNYGGNYGKETGLPNKHDVTQADVEGGMFDGYYTLDLDYLPRLIEEGDTIYGYPLYNTLAIDTVYELKLGDGSVKNTTIFDESRKGKLSDDDKAYNQLLFKNQNDRNLTDEIFLALVDDALIPLDGHSGKHKTIGEDHSSETLDNYHERLSRRYYHETLRNIPKGKEFYVAVTAWDRGLPLKYLDALESGKDANMMIHFPGPLAKSKMDNIYVVPNPYRGSSSFDGRIEGDNQGDKSRRLWFVNLPENCNVQIFTLAGDLVDEFEHNGNNLTTDIISVSKAAPTGTRASGIAPWNLLSKHNQIIASGLYFFSVKDHRTGDVKVGKFAVIR